MKPITRTLISMYAAAHVLLAGCATSVSRRPYSVRFLNHTPIGLNEDSNPETLGELAKDVDETNTTLGFAQRFEGITDKLEKNPDYNSSREVRILWQDIHESKLENKANLAQAVERFDYNKFDDVSKNTSFDKNTPFYKIGMPIIGGILFFGSMALAGSCDFENERRESNQKFLGALGLVGAFGVILYLDQKGISSSYYQKTYHHPFSGKSEVIDKKMRKPK